MMRRLSTRLAMSLTIRIPSVVLVEDDDIVANALRRQLEHHDFIVAAVVAEDEKVIAAIQQHRPAVVLMDVGIRGSLDGITLAEEILVCEDTPVVLLSGTSDVTLMRRAARSGAYGFLAKPTSGQSIITTLEMAIYKHEELRKARASS